MYRIVSAVAYNHPYTPIISQYSDMILKAMMLNFHEMVYNYIKNYLFKPVPVNIINLSKPNYKIKQLDGFISLIQYTYNN